VVKALPDLAAKAKGDRSMEGKRSTGSSLSQEAVQARPYRVSPGLGECQATRCRQTTGGSWCYCPRVAQRDTTRQANNRRDEGLSLKRQSEKGGRQKRAWGEKRSKLRGDVERGRNVPDKSIEHERGYFPVARRGVGDDLSTPSQRRNGMQTCRIACLSPLRDAKLQMALHLCRQGSRNVSRKSKQAVYYAVATSAKPKTFAKVAGRP